MGFYYLYLTSKDYQKNENEDGKGVTEKIRMDMEGDLE